VTGDVLSVVEAAYADAGDADTWLRGTLAAIAPHLDRGAGVLAHRFAHEGERLRIWSVIGQGADESMVAQFGEAARGVWQEEPHQTRLRAAYYPRAPSATTIRRLFPTLDPSTVLAELVRGLSVPVHRDGFGVYGADPSGHGCLFFTLQTKPLHVSARTLAHWERVAVHLAAGYRLARRRTGEADAVLDPVGKVLHLENGVSTTHRESLSHASRAIDRARGKLRRVDPDRALSLWKGLVAGRWSLVEHFDHDGKRYLVAKRNGLDLRPWPALTDREAQALAFVAEGQTLKLVGYQLGVSTGTVAGDLMRAQRKVGVASRLELVAAYRARRAAEEGP
jgi:DNA-binding CsgD family transcriptional regulator